MVVTGKYLYKLPSNFQFSRHEVTSNRKEEKSLKAVQVCQALPSFSTYLTRNPRR